VTNAANTCGSREVLGEVAIALESGERLLHQLLLGQHADTFEVSLPSTILIRRERFFLVAASI
jgi:hypothetical protein